MGFCNMVSPAEKKKQVEDSCRISVRRCPDDVNSHCCLVCAKSIPTQVAELEENKVALDTEQSWIEGITIKRKGENPSSASTARGIVYNKATSGNCVMQALADHPRHQLWPQGGSVGRGCVGRLVVRSVVHGQSMDSPWTFHGQSMNIPWTVHEQSMNSPWTVHGLSMDSPWTVMDCP